jgi:hypothetical protein
MRKTKISRDRFWYIFQVFKANKFEPIISTHPQLKRKEMRELERIGVIRSEPYIDNGIMRTKYTCLKNANE